MQVHDLAKAPEASRGGAVAVGNFDGVHRGHRALIESLRAEADAIGGRSVVVTFDPHPLAILRRASAPTPLTWIERRAELLAAAGVDDVFVCRTDAALLALSAREFFDRVLIEQLSAATVVEGPNFHFGRGREGNVAKLREFCESTGVGLHVVSADLEGEDFVSSTRIRERLGRGDVAGAARLLGRPHRLRGRVERGAGRGAPLGFPTANLTDVDVARPAAGVYAGIAIARDATSPAAVHVGPIPTFNSPASAVEAHLIGYHGDLYGSVLEIDLLERVRDVQSFSSPDDLVAQIGRDLQCVEQCVREHAARSRASG